MPNWIYCSPMVPLHMGVECGLLGARDMEHEFSNEWRAGAPRSRCLGARIEVRAMNAIGRRAELACRLAELRRLAERPKRDQR